MEYKTSEQAYKEYQKLKLAEEKLRRDNRGLNLINSKTSSPNFYIHFYMESCGNLLTRKSVDKINSNLPFMSWRFSEISINDFLKQLEEYCKQPIFERFVKLNRRQENEMSMWGLPSFRKDTLKFEDIEITFGEELLKQQSGDFDIQIKSRVRDILSTQKLPTESETKDFTRYFILCEKINDLDRQAKKKSYGGYSYGTARDTSPIKLSITDEEYNEKLLVIENELKKLCKSHNCLKLPDIKFRSKEEENDDEEDYDDEDYDEEYEDYDEEYDDEE